MANITFQNAVLHKLPLYMYMVDESHVLYILDKMSLRRHASLIYFCWCGCRKNVFLLEMTIPTFCRVIDMPPQCANSCEWSSLPATIAEDSALTL